ncbi:MAG: cupin domain-containing protein [Chloracidobacterium sp.]|nr:cupin domain-containing protein [Chloracidobacterium sp.]MDW8217464.1 cupin domain-containing protein [Acidobacteriota bacterium]
MHAAPPAVPDPSLSVASADGRETVNLPAYRFVPCVEPFRWEGVPVTAYQQTPALEADFAGVTRQTLFGRSGEAIGFEVRYFEIAPGGWSALERHEHAHAVIGLRGVGKVLMGDTVRTLGFLDLAYIGPNCVHRLVNDESTPFGFLCIVDARRDRPRRLRPADVSELLADQTLAAVILRSVKGKIAGERKGDGVG